MQRQEIEAIVLEAIRMANQAREPDRQLDVDLAAPLFGRGSPLDSLGLVALLFDIEDELSTSGWSGSLSSERAMSQERSPFRTGSTLVDFIHDSLVES